VIAALPSGVIAGPDVVVVGPCEMSSGERGFMPDPVRAPRHDADALFDGVVAPASMRASMEEREKSAAAALAGMVEV